MRSITKTPTLMISLPRIDLNNPLVSDTHSHSTTANRQQTHGDNYEKFNNAFAPNEVDESGIETYSHIQPSVCHYDGLPSNIYSNPSSVSRNTNTNTNINANDRLNYLNTSSLSCDLLNGGAGVGGGVKTRYDVKSYSSSSLYGSKNSIHGGLGVGEVSVNTNGLGGGGGGGMAAGAGAVSQFSKANSLRTSSKRSKLKKMIIKRIFTEDDAYAEGEYVKNVGGLGDYNADEFNTTTKKDDKRETWSGKFDFFLSCLGYAVGLGAVWRFPYLCYKNGGGVFLIPYTIFLFFVGIPLFYLELNLGQFTSQGPINCWKMAPIFKGLGISMNITSFYFCLYYNMIIAYSLYYLVNSFHTELEWSKCHFEWAGANCTDDFGDGFTVRCDQADVFRDRNGLCYNYSGVHERTPIGWWDVQKRLEYKKPVLPSQDYYDNYILQKTKGLENSGALVWQLVLALFAAWLIVFLCLFKGIKGSGKVVYFTSLFPFVVLIILGINGWRLEGAAKGIEFYIKPDFARLLDINVWFDAAVQIFFTMSTSYGGLITLASYNKFTQNTVRDTFIITISNALTAIFAGFVVFAYIGYLSVLTQQSVDEVISSGSGLAFIVFPFAVTKLAFPPFWSVLFFVMMLTLGLDSQFATLETIITTVFDAFPKFKKVRTLFIASLCSLMFVLGLPYCTRGGQYWIEIMDKFSSGWAVLIIGALECIAIGWVYGFRNFQKDIALMIGPSANNPLLYYYSTSCWLFISPALLVTVVVISWLQYKPLQTDDYIFPQWANVIGWLMTIFILMGMIGWAIYCVVDVMWLKKRSWRTLVEPELDWGPLLVENKRLAVHLKNLEPYHDSQRVKRVSKNSLNTISLSLH